TCHAASAPAPAARAAATRAGSRWADAEWCIRRSCATVASTPKSGTATRGASASSGWPCSSTTSKTSASSTNPTSASWSSFKTPVKISYEWLRDFVDLDGVTPKEAADALTRVGIEVESLTVIDVSEIVIGRVLEQKKHPKSRNDLWIHQVDLGDRTEQIIAGAPNAVPGSLVPVALPGTTVPNGKLVKDLNIAGFSAKGMLCSAEELLLSDDRSGILILDAGKPGDPLTSVIPNQAIMDAEVTSNRPDCMGHMGIA